LKLQLNRESNHLCKSALSMKRFPLSFHWSRYLVFCHYLHKEKRSATYSHGFQGRCYLGQFSLQLSS